jgi:DUF971 family protein
MRLLKFEQISSRIVTMEWDDGRRYAYPVANLRAGCPCAICRQERESANPLKVLSTDFDTVELAGWNWVGRYAVSLKWSDRHDSGIYTYEYLRKLCEEG